jgi:hypothetical protein
MKVSIKYIFIAILVSCGLYLFYNFLADAAYGEQNWIFRKMSYSVEESVERGVFVRKLNHRVDSFSGPEFYFEAFIEKAFTYGHKSVNETILMEGTQFPYRLSFESRPIPELSIFIKRDQLSKFDSSNSVWGYLKSPYLIDTIVLEIRGEGIKSGSIKVW